MKKDAEKQFDKNNYFLIFKIEIFQTCSNTEHCD